MCVTERKREREKTRFVLFFSQQNLRQVLQCTPFPLYTHFGKGLSLDARAKQVCVTLTPTR